MNGDKQIALPTLNKLEFVNIGDIIRCEAKNNYTSFHLLNGTKIVVCKTIGGYEELLSEYQFIRVHQSHLINLRHIKRFEIKEGIVIMVDNSKVEISRRKKEIFLKRVKSDLIN